MEFPNLGLIKYIYLSIMLGRYSNLRFAIIQALSSLQIQKNEGNKTVSKMLNQWFNEYHSQKHAMV